MSRPKRLPSIGATIGLALLVACGGPARTLPAYRMTDAHLTGRLQIELSEYPQGKPAALARYRGQVVLLDVWATWCQPCKQSLPATEALAKAYVGRPFALVTVNIDDDEVPVATFLAEQRLSAPVWRDPGGRKLREFLRLADVPSSFLIDRDGTVRFVHSGWRDDTSEAESREIEALLSE